MSKIFLVLMLMIGFFVNAKNPIIPNKGVNDPHIHIFEGRAYLYATHDRSIENTRFAMDEWGVWSSDDLVNWTLESVLKPEDTYIGRPYDQCWATDAAYRDGKYYFYFSEQNRQTGVVVGDTPVGPWVDVLGKPLLPEGLTSTHSYDQAIFLDDDGEHYIIFGVWDFYIARLNHDMISLAEIPRRITIHNPRGPYNQDGTNKEEPTDDKPFVHKYKGKYYLSWGAFYAMSDNLYGPYDYVGTLMNEESFAPGYAEPTWPNGFLQGRHGSFFEWHNQWYYAYCDISQTGNRRFRDTFISYVHFKDNGEIAPLRVDGIGVGEYDANKPIEAEDYFKASRLMKIENENGGFSVGPIKNNDYLIFNNVRNLDGKSEIIFNVKEVLNSSVIEIRENSPEGKLIRTCAIDKKGKNKYNFIVPIEKNTMNLCFLFRGNNNKFMVLDAFEFK